MKWNVKNIFWINDSLENRISYCHLLCFLLMLPFDRFYSEIILISFVAHVIIHLDRQKIRRAVNFKTLLLASPFLINVVGLIYSADKTQGFKDMERQLSILLFPFLIAASGLEISRYRNGLLKAFSLICVSTVVYLFLYNVRLLLYNHLPISYLFSTLFTNHKFSAPIGMHATYLSMYVSTSMICLLFFCLHEENKKKRTLYYAGIFILLAGLLQLASRNVSIATAFIVTVLYPLFIESRSVRIKFRATTVAITACAAVTILGIDGLRHRYTSELKNEVSQPTSSEILEPRIERWQVAWTLVKEAPLTGYGSGSEKRILMDQYFEQKLYGAYLHKLNAHNEYLSIMLKTGLWGLVIFLFTLAYGLATAWVNRDAVFASFVTLIIFICFSENILDVNKTIFFYSFFFSVLLYSCKHSIVIQGTRKLRAIKTNQAKEIVA